MKLSYLIIIVTIISTRLIFAQNIDEAFKEPVLIRPADIRCLKILPDGKIVLGGDIAFYYNSPVNNLIRLKPDCTIDDTFKFMGSNSLIIKIIEFQSTGNMIVLAEGYESVTGVVNGIFSLFQIDANGVIKKQIDSLKYANSIAVQDDDKVLVCGGDNRYGYLYRFNSDLSTDNSLKRISFNKQATSVKFKNKKIFLAGEFSLVSDTVKNDIVKLNLNGSIDPAFDTGSGTPDPVFSLTIQDDGKILLGKAYINSLNGTLCKGIVRLNPDGSVDSGFFPPPLMGMTSDIIVRDSSIFFAAYTRINNVTGRYLLRLKLNGSLDTDFVPFRLDESDPFSFGFALENNGIIFNQSSVYGSRYGLSKCDLSGSLISAFSPKTGRYGLVSDGEYFNGKLMIAGDFTCVNTTETHNIALLNDDGSVDPTFVLSSRKGKVIQVKILNKDTCLVSTGSSFFKLGSDARILTGFEFVPFKTLYNVSKFILLENRKIIAGDPNNIYRLNRNGSEDLTFNIGTGIGGGVSTSFDFDIQGDKIIYGSMFNKFNGIDVNRLIRLKSDASLDASFDIGSGPDGTISMIKVLKSGEIIVGGAFKNFNGISVPHGIVKLSQDGAINTTFNKKQAASTFSGAGLTNAKVEQVDSIIYIKNSTTLKALNINGTPVENFQIPFVINQIHDIITLKENSPTAKKSNYSAGDASAFMFALGYFKMTEKSSPSFIVKLAIGSQKLAVSPNVLTISGGINSIATFEITSNTSWNVSSDQPWLIIERKSGTGNSTITISATPNFSTEQRTSLLKVSGIGAGTRNITVIQEAAYTGIEDNKVPDIRIYPSPVTEKMVIAFSELPPRAVISIYSSGGELVFSEKISNTIAEINMSRYSPGIYFVKISALNKVLLTRKVIKQ